MTINNASDISQRLAKIRMTCSISTHSSAKSLVLLSLSLSSYTTFTNESNISSPRPGVYRARIESRISVQDPVTWGPLIMNNRCYDPNLRVHEWGYSLGVATSWEECQQMCIEDRSTIWCQWQGAENDNKACWVHTSVTCQDTDDLQHKYVEHQSYIIYHMKTQTNRAFTVLVRVYTEHVLSLEFFISNTNSFSECA